MMQGEFMDSNQIILSLTLQSEEGREEQIDVVLDTGFTGFLIVPGNVVRRLNLPQLDISEMVLADGSRTQMAVYEVVILWNNEEKAVLAYAGKGDALLGMSLLRDCLGTFEFFPGGLITIEPAE